MNLKTNILRVVAIAISFIIFNPNLHSNANPNISDIKFFTGNWDCKLQNSPHTAFQWSVVEENSRLNGVVLLRKNKVTSDFWQIVNGKIERFATNREGLSVNVKSNGWESNKLVFSGSFRKPNESFQARQTITKKNDKEFQAIWERINSNRRWITFSDEICTR
jgi:hypothetical protein